MAAWYDGVEVYVELAWGAGPLTAAASRTWTDHSDACMSIDIMRGSQSEFGHIPPGTATIVLNDPGRVFDASNTAGAHYGSIVPMVPVRVRAGAVALFTGFVAAFVLSWPAGGKAPIATLTCQDGTRPIESARLPGSAYEAAVLGDSPINYWPLQTWDNNLGYTPDVAGGQPFSAGDYSGSTELTEYAGAPLGGDLMAHGGGGGGEATASEVAAVSFWIANSGNEPELAIGEYVHVASATRVFSFTGRQVRYVDTTAGRYLDFTDVPPLALALGQENVPVHVAAYVSGTTIYVLLNGVQVWSSGLTAGAWPMIYGTGLTLGDDIYAVSHLAAWSSAPSASDFLAHVDVARFAYGHPTGECGDARTGRILDAIDHPAADRNLEAGHTVLGPWYPAGGDALSAIRETVGPEQALFHFDADGDATWLSRNWQRTATEAATPQATFGDQVGEIRYTDDAQVTRSVDNIYNYSTVTYADGSVSAEDATSIAAYGEQRDSVSAGLIDDAFTARQLAAARVREHKDAADRIDVLTILPRRGNDAAPNAGATSDVVAALAGLDLGYRVAVNRRPTGGTGTLALEPVVRGIAHQIDMSAKGWRTTLYLAPAPTSYEDGPWLTLGDPTYGDIGIAAGNLIPY